MYYSAVAEESRLLKADERSIGKDYRFVSYQRDEREYKRAVERLRNKPSWLDESEYQRMVSILNLNVCTSRLNVLYAHTQKQDLEYTKALLVSCRSHLLMRYTHYSFQRPLLPPSPVQVGKSQEVRDRFISLNDSVD